MPSPSTSEPGSEEITTPPNSPVKSPDEKPAPPLSRFSVSRFSITHVSDPEMDSMGGQFCCFFTCTMIDTMLLKLVCYCTLSMTDILDLFSRQVTVRMEPRSEGAITRLIEEVLGTFVV